MDFDSKFRSYWRSFVTWASNNPIPTVLALLVAWGMILAFSTSIWQSLLDWITEKPTEYNAVMFLLAILGLGVAVFFGLLPWLIKIVKGTKVPEQVNGSHHVANAILASDLTEHFESQITERDDEKTQNLINKVRGDGRQPTFRVSVDRCPALTKHLSSPDSKINPEMKARGWFTVSEAFLNLEGPDQLKNAKKYYKRGLEFYNKARATEDLARIMKIIGAKILFWERKHEKALKMLSESDDPKVVKLRLAMLIDYKRFDDVKQFLQENEVNPSWADMAIAGWGSLGDIDQAETVYNNAKAIIETSPGAVENPDITLKVIDVALAETLNRELLRIFGREVEDEIRVKAVSSDMLPLAKRAIQIASPIARGVAPEDLANNRLAERAARVCFCAYQMVNQYEEAIEISWRLAQLRPIEKNPSKYLVTRSEHLKKDQLEYLKKVLQQDHPQMLWAVCTIAYIDFYESNYKDAFKLLSQSESFEGDTEDSRVACGILLTAGRQLDKSQEAMKIVRRILNQDSDYFNYCEAKVLSEKGEYAQAESKLEAIQVSKEDNGFLFEINRLRGRNAIGQKEWEKARLYLEKAREHCVPDALKIILPDLLTAATGLQDANAVVEIVSKMEKIGPVEKQALFIKAQALFNLRRFTDAEKILRPLYDKHRDEKVYAIRMANIVGKLGRFDEAARIVEPFCSDNEYFDFEALRLRVHSLNMGGNINAAYESLNQIRQRIWDDPSFLMEYMQLAYKTGNEQQAGEITLRIVQLKQEGKIPDEVMTAKTIYDLKTLHEEHRVVDQKIQELYQEAKAFREKLCVHRGIPMHADWAERTRYLPSTLTQEQKSYYTTYATNGMRLENPRKIPSRLVPFGVPKDAGSVVITYTAMLTLYQLKLLNRLSKRFDQVYYCDEYVHVWAEEKSQLQPTQKSGEDAAVFLNEALQNDKIHEKPVSCSEIEDKQEARNVALAENEGCPLIDYFCEFEYTDLSDVSVIRIDQFLAWMHRRQLITKDTLDEVAKWTSIGQHFLGKNINSILDATDKVVFSLPALEGLHQLGALQKLLNSRDKQILVTTGTARQVQFNADFVKNRQETLSRHIDLTEKSIKYYSAFRAFSNPDPTKSEKEIPSAVLRAAAATMVYASQNKLPLLSDDRMTQMIYERNHPGLVFGSDALLVDLLEQNIIDEKIFAECYLQLLKWRYRFLIPPVRVLLYWARQYADNPPGSELKEIAKYAADCMNDPGLLRGTIPTEVPLPMSHRLHEFWLERSIDFLFAIWGDSPTFTDEKATELTDWILKDFLAPISSALVSDKSKFFERIHKERLYQGILLRLLGPHTVISRSKEIFQSVMRVFCDTGDLSEYICNKYDEFLSNIKHGLLERIGHEKRKHMIGRLLTRTLDQGFPLNARLAATVVELGIKVHEKNGEFEN